MAQILSINSSKQADLLDMFKAITSPNMDIDKCPGEPLSPRYIFPACVGCPLLEVCSDECGMNDANGYYPAQNVDASFDDDYKLLDW